MSRRLKLCPGFWGVPDLELKCSRTSTWRASTVSPPPLAHAASDSFSESGGREARSALSEKESDAAWASGGGVNVRGPHGEGSERFRSRSRPPPKPAHGLRPCAV